MEFPKCNLCGADQVEALYPSKDWQQVGGTSFRLGRCQNCGLIYLNPRPAPEEIGAFYQNDYSCYRPSVTQETNPIIRWARRRNLSVRRRAVERASGRQAGCILDVGCATGLFLNEMQQAGWKAYGVEPIASAAEYARREFGLEVFEGFFQDAPYPAASFDVITFWDVLEHTFSPQQELVNAARLLKPGGTLIINVPNWNSFDRRLFDAFWIGLDPPRHLYVFTRQTMRHLLSNAGLKVSRWACLVPSYYASVISIERWLEARHPWLLKGARRFLYFPGIRFLFSPWFWLTDAMLRSSLISVIAVKDGR